MDIQARLEATFLEFLVHGGIIAATDVDLILARRRELTAPLGRLALQRGYLNMKQITRILDEQIDDNRLFGQIAIDLGLLTDDQLNELLASQQLVKPSVSAVAVAMGLVDAEAMENLTTDFVLSSASVL
jgi:hypothetical protein